MRTPMFERITSRDLMKNFREIAEEIGDSRDERAAFLVTRNRRDALVLMSTARLEKILGLAPGSISREAPDWQGPRTLPNQPRGHRT